MGTGQPRVNSGLAWCGGSGNRPALQALARMDRQSKREIWLLAIGTIILEAPLVAIVALAIAAR